MSSRRKLPRALPRIGLAAAVLVAGTLTATYVGASGPGLDGFSDKVRGLVADMTLDEKISLVHGDKDPADIGEAGYTPGVPRLGIPALRLADGPAGLRLNEPSLAMPAPVALASSFDDKLADAYGATMGKEGRALGVDALLAPTVNSIRVPYGGRNFETFSEDPLVSSRTAAAETRGIAGQGMIPVVKHFAGNNQENDRETINLNIDERTLQENELQPFQAAVNAGAGAAMCQYSNLNGKPACANSDLLQGILREQMGFKGWVMSDWRMSLSSDAMNKGMDQEMPAGTYFKDELKKAVNDGKVPQAALDGSVARILGQMERFHLLDKPAPRPARDLAAGTRTAQQVAESGAVLLHNKDKALPLDGSQKSIAVIGARARDPKLGGGGSSHVQPKEKPTAPLDAIKSRAGSGTSVTYEVGEDPAGAAIPDSALSPGFKPGSGLEPGKQGAFYDGRLTVPTEGDYVLNVKATGGGGFVQVDGRTSALFGDTITTGYTGLTVHLTAGTHKVVLFGYSDYVEPLRVDLHWITPQAAQASIDKAVAAAKSARTAVVFASDDSSEGLDRPNLSLPGHQDALIKAVAAANPRTVVVLNTASAVKMPWLKDTAAVLDMWYPGQKGAEATAALLFGDVNPSGRLTQTFPADEDHTPVSGDPSAFPGVDGQVQYREGIYSGYRWYQKNSVKPLFPFGHGLTYTSFAYSGLKAARASDGGLDVSLTVRNTGSRPGKETPQVYIGPSPDVKVPQAQLALAGYSKVALKAGESRQVTVHVDPQQLKYWDTGSHSWHTGTGVREIKAGPSSAELPLTAKLTVT
ncbi:beta-glucosidase [Streptomyces sp. NPDC001339]|uniref:beta-glucosidase family protein n=1 Tax=Streptomyces sp. NPDC001339 TaxID=3364563 RepID=UPI0036D1C710